MPPRQVDRLSPDRLTSESIEDKGIAVATFLDKEEAFNNVSIDSLVVAQGRRGVPPKTLPVDQG